MEGTTKKIAESTKCYICSFISLSKNKVYIFGKTSADLAGIIRLSLKIDVNKYSEDSKLFVCRECFQQLTKYERAAKKLQEIKQELLSTCRNSPGGVLPSNRLMGMCRWMGSHFHDWIDYNGVAFSLGVNRVTRMGSHICGISGVSKFRQVGIWGIFAQK